MDISSDVRVHKPYTLPHTLTTQLVQTLLVTKSTKGVAWFMYIIVFDTHGVNHLIVSSKFDFCCVIQLEGCWVGLKCYMENQKLNYKN